MKILLLITTLTLVECRPQNQEKEEPISIEFGSFYQTHPVLISTNILDHPQYPSYFYEFISPNKPQFHPPTQALKNLKDFKEYEDLSRDTTKVIEKKEENIQISNILNERTAQIQKLLDINEAIKEMNAKVAPYKSHPLLNYVKNKNTIEEDKLIRFRSNLNGKDEDTITLILKPAAKAVAGQEGKAIANPISRAILRQGTNVDILFEPEAVAIAGPGGIAHAESDLEINYEET